MTELGVDSTTDEVLLERDLSGHVSLVTGASGGLGFETARALAAHGAHVVMAARDPEKNRAAADRIRAQPGAGQVDEVNLDLSDLKDVRRATDEIINRYTAFDSVIANAGIMGVPAGRTADGFESHLGVNHLAHFVFVNRLVPLLLAGAPSRVVVLSSLGHRWADLDFDDLNYDRRPYRKFQAYGASKTGNVLFAVELDARLARHGVRAYALHPGGIQTELSRYMTDVDRAKLSGGAAAVGAQGKSVAQGAATTVWAATHPALIDVGGVYLEDCAVAAVTPPDEFGGVSDFAVDQQRAREFWALSEELVGESFPVPG